MSAAEACVLVCRAGYERVLCEEVSWKASRGRMPGGAGRAGADGAARKGLAGASSCDPKADAGWVVLGAPPPPRSPFIFERQRLPRARWHPLGPALLEDLFACWAESLLEPPAGPLSEPPAGPPGPWTLHAYAPNPDSEDSLSAAARGLGQALLRALGARHPPLALTHVEPEEAARPRGALPAPPHAPLPLAAPPHAPPPLAAQPVTPQPKHRPPAAAPAALRVLQLCRVEGGVWSSLAPMSDLADPWPGGVHRMPEDPAAPSRSALKLEEAFDVMECQPRPGERAVDLGAAPGGWSWALVKRGCSVIAVDNGPLKLASLGDWGGELTHVRQDGLRFRPQRPVDWLTSDMLIAPGQALGLLRKWHAAGWARRFVVNFKLPQREPWAALAPLCTALDALPGLRYRLRQLYHDRREVTLLGESTLPSGAAGSQPRGHSGAAGTGPRGHSGAAGTGPRGHSGVAGPAHRSGRGRAAAPFAPGRAAPSHSAGGPSAGGPSAHSNGAERPAGRRAARRSQRKQGKAAPGGRTNHPRRRGRQPGGRRG